jgi:hypothetical protein
MVHKTSNGVVGDDDGSCKVLYGSMRKECCSMYIGYDAGPTAAAAIICAYKMLRRQARFSFIVQVSFLREWRMAGVRSHEDLGKRGWSEFVNNGPWAFTSLRSCRNGNMWHFSLSMDVKGLAYPFVHWPGYWRADNG